MLAALAAAFADELVDGTKSAALPLIRDSLHLSYGQIGLLAAVPLIAGSLIELPMGILAVGRRRRWVVLAGGLVFIASLLAAAAASTFVALLAALVVFFPASGAFVSLTEADRLDAAPARRAQFMARWTLVGALGAVAGPALLSAVVAAGGSWRGAYVVTAVVAAASWLGLAGAGRTPAGETRQPGETLVLDAEPDPEPAGFRQALVAARSPSVLRWLILLQVADLLLDVLTGFVALYLVAVAGVSPAQAALAVGVRLAAGLAGSAVLVPVLERWPGRLVLRTSAGAALALYPAFLLVPGFWPKVCVLAALSVVTSAWYPVLQAELYESLPGRSGVAVSLTSAATLAGGLGPLAVGYLAGWLGLGWALAGLVIVPACVLAGSWPDRGCAGRPARADRIGLPAVTETTSGVRVRFAPSPPGVLHVGSARSALFHWVVARQSGGALVLRIEDTDAARNRPEWIEGIVTSLAWLGITPDQYEGPFLQSGNLALHQAAADRLHEQGLAYYCDCSREMIVARTGDSHRGYDGFCRDRGLAPAPGRALRFRTPDEGATVVDDQVRGKTTFENATLEDFVIARGDGSVLFLLANVVDDISQRITLVIRAEEHLSNTPKQQLLWVALGQQPPGWAHVPIIVNERRQKLSKRRDKVALESFRDEGYLSSAMRNYLMLLGWAPRGDREIVSWDTIVAEFRLDEVNPSPAFFDVKKLRAFNGEYIRALSPAEFEQACAPWLTPSVAPWPAERFDPAVFSVLARLAQTRVSLLAEITAMVDFAFLDMPDIDEASWAKAMKEPTAESLLADVIAAYETVPWQPDDLRLGLTDIGTNYGLSLGKAQAPVRVAVTGRTVGLPLFESLEVLGREQTLRRLAAARERLTGLA